MRPAHQRFCQRTRLLFHQLPGARFGLEHDRAGRIDDQFEKGDMHGGQQQRPAKQQRQQRQQNDRHMHRQGIDQRLTQVGKDAPAQRHRPDNGGEVILQQDQRRRLAGHIGAAFAHGDADMRRFQCRRVVDPVTGHGHHFAIALECLDDGQFLRRRDPGKHRTARHAIRELGSRHRCQLRPAMHLSRLNAGRLGNGPRSTGVIAGDHQHADTRLLALGNGRRHLVA